MALSAVLALRRGELAHWRDYLDPVAVFDAVGSSVVSLGRGGGGRGGAGQAQRQLTDLVDVPCPGSRIRPATSFAC
jgi:hypothetical protein